ncbi:ATPase [Escherichia coli]
MPHSYAEYHHFIMMSLMSGEHNTLRCLFRMNPARLVPVG